MRIPTLPAAAVLALSLAACSDDPGSPGAAWLVSPEPLANVSKHLASGRVESVLLLTHLNDMPEGIAVNHQGDIFVGNRRLAGEQRVSEILRITPDNTVSVFATLGSSPPGNFVRGVLGLAVNPNGDLYAAFPSDDPATHGVWRIGRRGGLGRLAGSAAMLTPNALAFDTRGNLYATDSQDGTIWRFPHGGPGALWLRHPLLTPSPGIGANGIAFVPPATLFVANTELALIARIPIRTGGSPGEPAVAAAGFELLLVDGLAADVHGDLYAAIAGSTIFGTAPVVRIDPRTGEITPSTDQADRFDFPTSLAFGSGLRDRKSVYVVNAALFPEDRPEAAPSVVRVGVGVPAAPIR
jgi:sugar lactone lactonase YvrE